MSFVDDILFLNDGMFLDRNSLIGEFILKCSHNHDLARVDSWLSKIAGLDIMNLELSFSFTHIVDRVQQPANAMSKLPTSFFNRRCLRKLTLSYMAIGIPSSVNFPCLRRLSLSRVNILNKDGMDILLSGCPALEVMVYTKAFWDLSPTNIRSSTVRHLSVEIDPSLKEDHVHRMVVETPKIELLRLIGNLSYNYDLGELSSLKGVMFAAERDGLVSPDTNALSDRLNSLLRMIQHVEHLWLCESPVRFLENASFVNFPVFHNLRELSLKIGDCCWKILPPLLEHSPNLVRLVSKKVFMDNTELVADEFGWSAPACVPQCLVNTLTVVEFEGFEVNPDEIEMIRYLLMNALVLKTVYIRCRFQDLDMMQFALKQILRFPRSSTEASIDFS